MQERTLTLPEIGMIAGTRVGLGIGVGLLLSGKLNRDQRRGAGLALLAMGILTTIPLVMTVRGKRPSEKSVVLAA